MSAQKKKKSAERFKEVRNAKALRNFSIEERLETGIVLTGTEVKSIRQGKAQINDAFARIERGEVILYHAHVDEYSHGNINNHNPVRPRKLLLHKREILRLEQAVNAGGYALVPIRLYFKQALVKVEIGLGKGKKLHDKREDLKRKDHQRDIDRALRNLR